MAEDTVATPPRPLCECHGEPMYWHKDARSKAGGGWRCRVKRRASGARYYEKNLEKEREKGRKRNRVYYEKNREKMAAAERSRYSDRISQGLCGRCGKDVRISDSMCFDCLGKQDEYNLTRSVV